MDAGAGSDTNWGRVPSLASNPASPPEGQSCRGCGPRNERVEDRRNFITVVDHVSPREFIGDSGQRRLQLPVERAQFASSECAHFVAGRAVHQGVHVVQIGPVQVAPIDADRRSGFGQLALDPATEIAHELQRRIGESAVERGLFRHAVQLGALEQLSQNAGLRCSHARDDAGRLNAA